MAETREDWINKRAYALWEEEGRPDGRHDHHWQQANMERDALESSAASVDGAEVKAKSKKTSTNTKAPKTIVSTSRSASKNKSLQ